MQCYDALNGIYLYELGRVSGALAFCRIQLAQDGDNAQAHATLAWAHLGKGEYEKALEVLKV